MKRRTSCILIILFLFLLAGCKNGDIRKVEKAIDKIGTVTLEKEPDINNARNAFELLSDSDKVQVDNISVLASAESQLKICKVEQEIDKIGVPSELEYDSKELVDNAQAAFNELSESEQSKVHNVNTLHDAIAAIDSLAFDELERSIDIALMKGIIDTGFSGNKITYKLNRENRNYIDASSAYFLYPAIAANFINSIKSNCEKICKDFYKKGTEQYGVDCTFIMNDCYGGEIFTIVNGEVQK